MPLAFILGASGLARSTLSQFVVGKTRSGDFDEGLCRPLAVDSEYERTRALRERAEALERANAAITSFKTEAAKLPGLISKRAEEATQRARGVPT